MALETKAGVDAPYILWLDDIDRDTVARAGSKAANLGELARAGFPVPHGFVVTTRAFHDFLSANGLSGSVEHRSVVSAPLPPDITASLRDAARAFDGAPLAVRSSGVAEDTTGASFAGQYETFLDVRGEEATLDAVRRCWASAFSKRVVSYSASQGMAMGQGMAVLVQRLVSPSAAGVAFTANPVTGERGEIVVSAVRGLGERLVSGEASPDEWIVRGDEAICERAPEGAVDRDDVIAVARMARQVEDHFGSPQDIEWAIADGQTFLLQARPITTLGQQTADMTPIPIEVPPGFWERESAHQPQPLTPMYRSTFFPAHERAFRAVFEQASLLAEGLEFREIGGWLYSRLVPLGGRDRPAPPAPVMAVLVRLVPELRQRMKGMARTVRSDLLGTYLQRWQEEWKPRQVQRIGELQDVDLAALSDDALESQLQERLQFLEESLDVHAKVTAVDFLLADLAIACRDLLRWPEGQWLDLLSGLSEMTSLPARRLAELTRMVRGRPALRALLDDIDGTTIARLAETDTEFLEAFEAYRVEYGARALSFEVAEPTIAEQPELILRLIRDQVAAGYDPEGNASALRQCRENALAAARAALQKRSAKDRERFETALRRAEQAYPVRDDHEFYLTSAPIGLLRHALLEVGRRFFVRGAIAATDDVFYLEFEEALAVMREGRDEKALVGRRKAERAWALAHPGPRSYGTAPGPPPPLGVLPKEARQLMSALVWEMQNLFANEASAREHASDSRVLAGIAASAGSYKGTARIVHDESEFGKLLPGDVLVCPTTSPVWSVLFASVGALVTDAGGVLSHPAIIAREYRIPAVVATGNATSVVRDGATVVVNGNAGTVEVLS